MKLRSATFENTTRNSDQRRDERQEGNEHGEASGLDELLGNEVARVLDVAHDRSEARFSISDENSV